MKSIIQEASSIAKAVEEGWLKAQKPRQFSVKILEEAEKNFLGLTKKSAKVAIFFDEVVTNSSAENKNITHQNRQPRSTQPGHKQEDNRQRHSSTQRPPQQQQQAAHTEKSKPLERQPAQTKPMGIDTALDTKPVAEKPPKKQFEPLWNQGMVERTEQWMHHAFQNSNNQHIQFSVEPQKFHLRITLSTPILSDPDKEKQLLASFSALILETLKRTFKMSLRGHKIVLTHKK